MQFKISGKGYNINDLMRKLRYKPIGYSPEGQMSCVRPLGADYPRFHAYVTETKEGYTFNLHLDQKKVSYEGVHAHNGEYEGDIISEERNRIEAVNETLD